jgi:hypothetical protein
MAGDAAAVGSALSLLDGCRPRHSSSSAAAFIYAIAALAQ